MTLYPDELQNTDGTITQLTNEELRSLLKEKDQELETLKSSHAAPEDSWKSTYELISSLEKYKTEEVLFYAAQVLGTLMDSRDVAIYTVANKDYARLFSSTSAQARKLGNSIKYTDMEELYEELKEHRVYINRTMAEGLPLMACAVYAQEEMQLILMLWGIPWQRMTLAEANRLTIVGTLIQNATVRASRYMDMLKSQRYVENTNVLREEAFTQIANAFFEARDKGLTECTLLEISAKDGNCWKAASALEKHIRQTDYMGVLGDGTLYILLSNTDREHAGRVIDRFKSSGYESLPKEGII